VAVNLRAIMYVSAVVSTLSQPVFMYPGRNAARLDA